MYSNGSMNNSLYMCVSSKHFHCLILTFNHNLDIKQFRNLCEYAYNNNNRSVRFVL